MASSDCAKDNRTFTFSVSTKGTKCFAINCSNYQNPTSKLNGITFHRAATFQHKPSLKVVCDYLKRDCFKRYPLEKCPLCKKRVLAEDPKNQLKGRKNQIERVYCGHLFHNGCLDTYMKTPPFIGGKECPSCDKRIYHEKSKVSAEVMENRWAHKQAKQRKCLL